MNRRNLLKLMGLGIIGAQYNIDQLLRITGQKTIFITSPSKYPWIRELSNYKAAIIKTEINKIKEQIQSVIGQME